MKIITDYNKLRKQHLYCCERYTKDNNLEYVYFLFYYLAKLYSIDKIDGKCTIVFNPQTNCIVSAYNKIMSGYVSVVSGITNVKCIRTLFPDELILYRNIMKSDFFDEHHHCEYKTININSLMHSDKKLPSLDEILNIVTKNDK